MRYCIALEYAVHGDLSVWLGRKGAQSERDIRTVAGTESDLNFVEEVYFRKVEVVAATTDKNEHHH